MQASTIAKVFGTKGHKCFFGTSLIITSDRSALIELTLFQQLAQLIRAKLCKTTLYHSQRNDVVVRMHLTLKAAICCTKQPWL